MRNLQNSIQSVLDQLVADGTERGVQAALFYRGELVVDAFAGTMSPGGAPVTGETLFPVFSTTKGMMATIIHRLVERGILNYEAPIAHYWPEFGAQGKDGVLVRHALTHTAGLPLMPLDIGIENVGDWDAVCAGLAQMAPVSAPGEREEYHAITQGFLLGEVASRAAGHSINTLWHEELVVPLGLESSLFCGLPPLFDHLVARLEEPNPPQPEKPAEPTPEAIPHWIWPLSDWMNRTDAQRACVPASNGIMTARAIAHHFAALLPWGVDGVQLLTPERVKLASQRFTDAEGNLVNWALGYNVGGLEWLPTALLNGGYGGSLGFGDPVTGWAYGFVRNRFTEANSAQTVLESLREVVG